MGIKSLFEKNALNKIKKKGYTDEQAKVMYEAMWLCQEKCVSN